jgi:tRNA (cytidine/uridine-2'-O-)-methyltransferase
MAFNIVIYEPLIPQNTGTIARLTAATNTYLHLIEPLGFEISDRYLKRAGLDYWPWVKLTIHKNWEGFLAAEQPERIYVFTSYAEKPYWDIRFQDGDYLVFGNETRGFPDEFRERYLDRSYVLPMENEFVRSLNVSCTVSTVLYEALRQVA